MDKKITNINLLTDTYQVTEKSSTIIQNITHKKTNILFWKPPISNELYARDKTPIYFIQNIPPYLNINYQISTQFKVFNFSSVYGYAMDFNGINSATEYMQTFLHKKVRANIKRSLRRLEHSFNITYKRYYGEINGETYKTLMTSLKVMIINRFNEREEQSDTLKTWKTIFENSRFLINNKKASLFVIYHDSQPISISLSYHYGKTFFYYIASYDIDYYKYSLGHSMIVKQLEWCLDNDFEYLEMGWGDLDYKRRWCNMRYTYSNNLILSKRISLANFQAYTTALKKSLIAFLIKKRINVKIKQLKQVLKPNQIKNSYLTYETVPLSKTKSEYFDDPISLNDYDYLKPYIYTFLYNANEIYSDISLFKSKKELNVFYIKGKVKSIKLFPKIS